MGLLGQAATACAALALAPGAASRAAMAAMRGLGARKAVASAARMRRVSRKSDPGAGGAWQWREAFAMCEMPFNSPWRRRHSLLGIFPRER